MSHERFDRDLAQVLRAVAGEEAPMSLRYRLAIVTEQAPISRRLWFAPPMRLSLAAVAAVAVIVLAIMLVPRDTIGPTPSESPGSPTPSAEESATPIPSQRPTPTLAPTPEPTPALVADWTHLSWMRTTQPAEAESWFVVTGILAWGDAYVAGGWIDADDASELAFFSLSGSQWRLLSSVHPPNGWSYEGTFLAPVPGGILSVARLNAPPESEPTYEVRISPDGVSWETISDPAWNVDWMTNRINGLAAGPSGVVAVADSEVTGGSGVVLHSPDGRVWERVELPASDAVSLRDVTADAGGFVAVGRDGEADSMDPVTGAWSPGTGRPAAWISSDGLHWVTATVDGAVLPGAELRTVIAGADGLFATGVEQWGADARWGLGTTAWVSTDGQTWRNAGELGSEVPAPGLLAGDGTHMVLIGMDPQQAATAEVNDWVDSATWVSDDGEHWIRMQYEGEDVPRYLLCPPDTAGCGGSPRAAWVLPNGVAVAQGVGVPMDTILFGLAEP